ncbi:hypothetical protein JQ594_00825 [Bradyrhizobium manausense]|uniref:hypothetical protein n=1 Tax=Bradyrhizobium manausense TaxID=989370 RepID=UPI001BAB6435|nr:hypothetical protein [Bradyrhizobium manausense]MBR0684443.1 hypothetical protein [Bradyrhizobium manausense]
MTAGIRFLIVGAIFCIALAIIRYLKIGGQADQQVSAPWTMQLLPATLAAVLGWLVLWLIERLLATQFLAGGAEVNANAEASRWSALAYFVAMVVGMIAQTIWHALQNRQPNAAPSIDKWEFLKPALVAPIVFVAVYQNIAQPQVSVAMLLFSFQNGFFWQTVLRKSDS